MAGGISVDVATGITLVFATSAFTAELKDVNLGFSREMHDVTHQGSAQPSSIQVGGREFLPADFADAGEVAVDFHYNPSDIPPINLAAELITLTWPKAATDTTAATIAGTGFMTDFTPTGLLDQVMTASATLKWSGVVSIVAAV